MGALEELLTADKLADAINHFPSAVQEAVSGLTEEEKSEATKHLLVKEQFKKQGYELRNTNDPTIWQMVDKAAKVRATATVANTFISGADSLVVIKVDGLDEQKDVILISLRLEAGEWRVMSLGSWRRGVDFESEEFVRHLTPAGRNEEKAESVLMRTCSAVGMYRSRHPEMGFPAELEIISQTSMDEEASASEEAEEPDTGDGEDSGQKATGVKEPALVQKLSPEQVLMVDEFKKNHLIQDGYEFHYTLIDSGVPDPQTGKYQITATPVQFGKTGTRSLFTNQTGVIRSTKENREANENDDPGTRSFAFR